MLRQPDSPRPPWNAARPAAERPGGDWGACAPMPLPRLFVDNRRDGSRLLSSALVITGIGLVRIDHPLGQVVAVIGGSISAYWWLCYRQLQR